MATDVETVRPGHDAGANGGPPGAGAATGGYASGARVLTIGIVSTGVFTFAYLATASHVLPPGAYSRISLCWAIMFVILSVIYRPIEQLLSRTIADRAARGTQGHILRTPAIIQGSFALVFLAVALALRHTIERHLFTGSSALYWILVIGVLAYAASYFARGWLAGNRRFALYGGLVFLESTSRFLFALAVAVGIGSGQGAVGLGMAAAPFVSLSVIPFAFRRMSRGGGEGDDGGGGGAAGGANDGDGTGVGGDAGASGADAGAGGRGARAQRGAGARAEATREVEVADAAREGPAHAQLEEATTDLSLMHGTSFAVAVVAIMLSEQTLMNAGVLVVAANSSFNLTLGLTGFVFNVLLIVRAPLQLFQAVQTSILPHLTGLHASESGEEFHKAIRLTVLVIVAFAVAVAIGLLAIGPFVMTALLGDKGFHYARLGLAVVGLGMGLHLIAGTLNQAALARGRATAAAVAWLIAAALFVLLVAEPTIANEVTRVEVGYFTGALVLCGLLWAVYRRGPARDDPQTAGS